MSNRHNKKRLQDKVKRREHQVKKERNLSAYRKVKHKQRAGFEQLRAGVR